MTLSDSDKAFLRDVRRKIFPLTTEETLRVFSIIDSLSEKLRRVEELCSSIENAQPNNLPPFYRHDDIDNDDCLPVKTIREALSAAPTVAETEK